MLNTSPNKHRLNPNFELVSRTKVPEIDSEVLHLRHKQTGADVLSLINTDDNKVFGVAFRTPVSCSNGVPHILEHSVLCGSQAFPVKDPFIQMARSSLRTYLNATTWPDRTLYPVASTNTADIENLRRVYMDAVFKPLLTEQTFLQEGWHYEFDAETKRLKRSGIVLNEMKGAYADPDSALTDGTISGLLPDTLYKFDAGGDPAIIPTLTYEQFVEYHRTYYHPSNALIFFSGNDDPAKRLELVEEYLSDYERVATPAEMPLQKRWATPQEHEVTYPCDDTASDVKRDMVTVNWLIGEVSDFETRFGLAILDKILTGSEGAPLRRALLASEIGEGIAFGGLAEYVREAVFGIGLRGMQADRKNDLEKLILETLSTLVSQGISPGLIDASLSVVEFQLREKNTGSTPRGLVIFTDTVSEWRYGRDLLEHLQYEKPLAALKARLATGERYFEGLIEKYFLKNPHRMTLTVRADKTQSARELAAESSDLTKIEAALSSNERSNIEQQALELQRLQATPNTAEELATLPMLRVADLDRRLKVTPQEEIKLGTARILAHPLETQGVVYLDLAYNLSACPAALLPAAAFFGRIMFALGTTEQSFFELSERIMSTSGGIGAGVAIDRSFDRSSVAQHFFVRGKSLRAKFPDMLQLISDVQRNININDRQRIRKIALEQKAGIEQGLLGSGHRVVLSRLQAMLDPVCALRERMSGIDYLDWVRALPTRIDNDWPSVEAELRQVQAVLNKSGLQVGITASRSILQERIDQVSGFINNLDSGSANIQTPAAPTLAALDEGLAASTQVFYVAKGLDLYARGYTYSAALSVVCNYISRSYLWDRVRVQGGAYGAFASGSRDTGLFAMASYRDPRFKETVAVYDQLAKHLTNIDLDSTELERLIIGTVGDFENYKLPDAEGRAKFVRSLSGESDQARQALYEEILSTSLADFRRLGEAIGDLEASGIVVALGPEEALKRSKEIIGRELRVRRVME